MHPGEGCNADHGATRYATTLNQRSGDLQYIKVREDSQSSSNWISPEIVKEFSLRQLDVEEEKIVTGFHGTSHVIKKMVEITLGGKGKNTEPEKFFVAPENFPFVGLLFGNENVKEAGHLSTRFLDEQEMMLMLEQKRVSVFACKLYLR